jgi:hypothetical protein
MEKRPTNPSSAPTGTKGKIPRPLPTNSNAANSCQIGLKLKNTLCAVIL